MKRIFALLLILAMVLTGCTTEEEPKTGTYYALPDLNGYTMNEIIDLFQSKDREYNIVFETVEDEDLELQFIMYRPIKLKSIF